MSLKNNKKFLPYLSKIPFAEKNSLSILSIIPQCKTVKIQPLTYHTAIVYCNIHFLINWTIYIETAFD